MSTSTVTAPTTDPAADSAGEATHPSATEPTVGRSDEATPSMGRATALVGAATLIASAGNYVLNLTLARWLSPARFGDANLIVTLLLAITAVALTLQLGAARRVSVQPAARSAIRRDLTRTAWIGGAAVAALVTACSGVLRDVTSSESAVPFALLALGLPWYLAQAVERGVLQGALRFRPLATSLVVEAFVRSGVGLALVAAGLGVGGATAGVTASFVASWLVTRHAVARLPETSGAANDDSTDARIGARAAAVLLVGQILVNNGDVVLAKLVFDADDAGVHSVVALIGRAIFFLSWSVVTVAFPMAAGDADDRSLERRAVGLVAAMSASLTVAVAIVGPIAAPIVFGPDYGRAGPLFLPYAIATSLFSIANVSASLAAARGRCRPGVIMIAGGIGQAALLALAADGLAAMSRLQVVTMAALLVAVMIERRHDRGGTERSTP